MLDNCTVPHLDEAMGRPRWVSVCKVHSGYKKRFRDRMRVSEQSRFLSFSALSRARAASTLSKSWRGPCSFWAYMTQPFVMWHTSLLIRWLYTHITVFGLMDNSDFVHHNGDSILIRASCYWQIKSYAVWCLSILIICFLIQMLPVIINTVSLTRFTCNITGASWTEIIILKTGCEYEGNWEKVQELESIIFKFRSSGDSSAEIHLILTKFIHLWLTLLCRV